MRNETDARDIEWMGAIESTVGREESDRGPTTDVVFDLLSRSHRRFALYSLYGEGEAMDIVALADAVVGLFEQSSLRSPDSARMKTRLAHTTLPRLADSGAVTYDREAGVAWPTDAVDAMGPLLEFASRVDFESDTPFEDLATE